MRINIYTCDIQLVLSYLTIMMHGHMNLKQNVLFLFSEKFLILRRIQGGFYHKFMSSCKALLILVSFNENSIFSTGFSKNIQISESIQIGPVAASCSMRRDRQTYLIKLIVAFLNFAEVPEKKGRNYQAENGIRYVTGSGLGFYVQQIKFKIVVSCNK